MFYTGGPSPGEPRSESCDSDGLEDSLSPRRDRGSAGGFYFQKEPGTLHQGMGIYVSLFLVLVAGLTTSVVMWQSNLFSRAAAAAGILANAVMLTYYVALVAAPALLVLPFVISAPFRVIWYFLIARKLLQLANGE